MECHKGILVIGYDYKHRWIDKTLIDVTTVPDPVFAQKMMGDSIDFRYETDKVTLCSPANGTLSVLFPAGHAFGITMNNGVELLVHCGIDTVNANGDGFRILKKKQGDQVKAGEPIVEVNIKRLSQKFDMSTMLVVTNAMIRTSYLLNRRKLFVDKE